MKIFGLSDIGAVRSENQDSFVTLALDNGILAAVCDGMGGAAAGRLASEITKDSFASSAAASFAVYGPGKTAHCLIAAADAANRAVYTHAMEQRECEGMGSTLVALFAAEDRVTVLNVGDSRAYRIRKDAVHQISHDHSLVQELVDSGEISEKEALTHPNRNVITRVIGGDIFVHSDIFESEASDGDRFLLCSDGLTNSVSMDQITQICLSSDNPENICRELIGRSLAAGARDNVTAVVLIYEKGADEQ